MMKQFRLPISTQLKNLIVIITTLLFTNTMAHAQIGGLLWEENFDSLDPELWSVDVGNGCEIGLCGWGNREREYYSPDNVSIEAIPGESGNNALVFEARQENATDTFGNNFAFTSGKVFSENGVTVHYGMIETRIRVPDLQKGLWPAFWMLGTTTAGWPRKGELDIMEMGHSDSAIESHGNAGTPQNNFVGANAIFYADAACVPGNETCAASTAYQTDNAYVSNIPMNDRFMTYRMYWTNEEIRFTAIDNGVEYDMYDNPIPINEESSELAEPFYFLMNLAVGGTFTGLLNDSDISAPLPAKMYIDYIRVYEFNGQGEVTLGNLASSEYGTYGVFTDTSNVSNQLEAGLNADIFVWNTNSVGQGTEIPLEGDNVIAWEFYTPNQWFGGGVQARQSLDMSQFLADGELTFSIKIPADVSFRIGITDTFTNQNWVVFPANETAYGLQRDGEWGQVRIPVSELQGGFLALQSIEYPFAIVSLDDDIPTNTFQFAIDDILWEGGGESSNPETPIIEPGTNIALNKATIQSSTDYNGLSLRAVDGNTNGRWRNDSVTHTSNEFQPWWQVDLENVNNIESVQVFNRTDNCCTSRLSDFYVLISDTPFTSDTLADLLNDPSVNSVYFSGTVNNSTSVNINHSGRYVRIQLLGTNPLSLAEVEVISASSTPLIPRDNILVEAEDYNNYSDDSAGNNGGAYKDDDVDIETTSDIGGGYNIGWTAVGEWLEYTVDLQEGRYQLISRTASAPGGGEFMLSIDSAVIGTTQVDATGGWQNWENNQAVEFSVLQSGEYTFRIDITRAGFNLNYFEFIPVDN